MQKRPDLTLSARRFRTAAAWVESAGARVLLAVDPGPEDGGGGGGRREMISRPTERLAVASLEGGRGWLESEQRRLLEDLHQADIVAERIVKRIGNISASLPTDASRSGCASTGCCRLASAGRAGYCDACRMWLRRHPEAASVPAEVIERRMDRGGPLPSDSL